MSLRIICDQRDGQWYARAIREENGDSFGIVCTGTTAEEATGCLQSWLDWQREHAAALGALQQAERAYHRTIAGSAFVSSADNLSAVELQKESLQVVEAARVRLDEVRARKPA